MQVVLLERIEKLGQMGDVVTVKQGYARNFLLPQNKALRATKANLARFEAERAHLEARNAELRAEAETSAGGIDGRQFVVIRSASDGGALYGSVTARDIAEAAAADDVSIDRRKIVLERPIKELGLHPVRVVLHPEVSLGISVNVARSAEEAELQASGRSIQDIRAEEDAETEFDLAELFDDIGSAAMEDGEESGPAPVVDAADESDSEDPRDR